MPRMYEALTAKIESKIAYKPDGSYVWGRATQGQQGVIEWFKLLLLSDSDLSSSIRDLQQVQKAKTIIE